MASTKAIFSCYKRAVLNFSFHDGSKRAILPPSIHRNFSSYSDVAKSDHKHCVDLVATRDRDGYLCGLLQNPQARQSLFSILAFNVEIASIKDSRVNTLDVSSITPSRLRMQWWREALESIYLQDNTQQQFSHPVVRSLARAVREKDLTRRFLERMIDARDRDLDMQQYPTLQDVVVYGEETIGSLLYLSLECSGIRDSTADTAASHIGAGLSIVKTIKSTPFRASRGEMSIPADLTKKYSVRASHVIHSPSSASSKKNGDYVSEPQPLQTAIREMASEARAHFAIARTLQSEVGKEGRLCLLPAVSGILYLDALEKRQFDIFDPQVNADAEGLKLLLTLGRTWLTGVF